MSLDDWLPEYRALTTHSIEVAAPVVATWVALRSADFGRSLMVRGLLSARGIGRSAASLDTFVGREFVLLQETPPKSIVLGMAGRPHKSEIDRVTATEFGEYSEPGSVRIGWSFTVEPHGHETIVRTATRIQPTDDAGWSHFNRYWRFIKPFSGLTRKAMLRVIKREAEGAVRL